MMKKENNDNYIPLHDIGRLRIIAEQQSMNYRINLFRIISIARIVVMFFLLTYIIFSEHPISFLYEIKSSYFSRERLFYLSILIYLFFVITGMLILYINAQSNWVFVIAAIVENISLMFVLSIISFGGDEYIFAIGVTASLMFSVITLSFRQTIVFAIYIAMFIIFWGVYNYIFPELSISVLDNKNQIDKIGYLLSMLILHYDKLFQPIFYASGLAIMVILLGYFASQARENTITLNLQHLYNLQLRKLNDSIIADIQSGLLVIDSHGVIITLNRRTHEIFGFENNERIPQTISQISIELSRQFGRWLHMQHNDNHTIDIGKYRYTITFSALQINKNTQLTLISLESIEESYRRVRETRLVSLGRLTAGIAHEIRNPLASVKSAADILAELSDDKQINFLVEKIQNNAERMNRIISDILNMFSDKPRNTRLINLNMFLYRIISESKIDLATNSATFCTNFVENNDYAIYFDPGQLSQIINNLFINAIKHSGKDNATITISTTISKVGRQIYIDVADDGIGVNSEDEERIFEPFYSRRQGTGLGLYLVREMCVANQAQIIYVGNRQGACFRITMERYKYDAQAQLLLSPDKVS